MEISSNLCKRHLRSPKADIPMNSLNETPDILITGGTLLTMATPEEIVEDPVIGIRNGKIDFIKKGTIPAEHCGMPARSSTLRVAS
jgi:hypothetical protein